ncbi:MAG TPA: rhodanese-like domain-containing protein [Burkholderiales bacterium]|nr:rhodanese-like domain-containing protein [Burkholderiales bacterium]
MERTIKPDALQTLMQTRKGVVVFDVRRKADYDADNQKVSGAMWLDPEKVGQWCTALPHDKQIVVYCARGGSVSNTVLDVLLGKSFKTRYIEGGIEAWKVAGGATATK